jgi:hypothetical protein
MQYMILQLNKEKYLDDVLLALTETGIDETIVLAGETLGHKLAFNNPIFAGFRDVVGNEKAFANIIMAYAEGEDQIQYFLEELKRADVDLIGDDIGKIVLIPITKIFE